MLSDPDIDVSMRPNRLLVNCHYSFIAQKSHDLVALHLNLLLRVLLFKAGVFIESLLHNQSHTSSCSQERTKIVFESISVGLSLRHALEEVLGLQQLLPGITHDNLYSLDNISPFCQTKWCEVEIVVLSQTEI